MILGRENRTPHVLRHRTLVKTLRAFGEVRERVDHLTRRTNPIRNVLVKPVKLHVDFVRKPHHRRLDDSLGQVLDIEGQFLRGELEVDAAPLVHRDRGLAFRHVLGRRNGTITNGKVSRLANRDRLTDFVTVDLLGKIFFIATENLFSHDQLVVENSHRSLCDDVRCKGRIRHLQSLSRV